jgi:hypothetical protein
LRLGVVIYSRAALVLIGGVMGDKSINLVTGKITTIRRYLSNEYPSEAVDKYIKSISSILEMNKVLISDEVKAKKETKEALTKLLKKVSKAIEAYEQSEEIRIKLKSLISTQKVSYNTSHLLEGLSTTDIYTIDTQPIAPHQGDNPGDNCALMRLTRNLVNKIEILDKLTSEIKKGLKGIGDPLVRSQVALQSLPHEQGIPRLSLHTLEEGIIYILELHDGTRSRNFVSALGTFWNIQSALDDPMFSKEIRRQGLKKINMNSEHPFWVMMAEILTTSSGKGASAQAIMARFKDEFWANKPKS